MSIRCGKCKGNHDTAADVRACYGLGHTAPVTQQQALPVVKRGASGGKLITTVPAGYYAVTSHTGNNDLDFIKVDRPTKGKWAGWVFVKRVIGGNPDVRIKNVEAALILQRLQAEGVEVCGARYGIEIGSCYVCNRHLTDETSRALGIGPECRKKVA